MEEAAARLRQSEEAVRVAEARLNRLIATPESQPTTPAAPKFSFRLPQDLPLCWRLGFLILESPKVDYATWGSKLWTEALPIDVVRNRLSTHLDRLKKLDVIVRDGDSYKVNSDKLAQHSGVPVITRRPLA